MPHMSLVEISTPDMPTTSHVSHHTIGNLITGGTMSTYVFLPYIAVDTLDGVLNVLPVDLPLSLGWVPGHRLSAPAPRQSTISDFIARVPVKMCRPRAVAGRDDHLHTRPVQQKWPL